MIDGIIAAQLRSAKRVVVPDLGSFIHKEGGQTVFMEFLKKDDGVLTAAIAREFGLDAAEAQAVAAEWALGVRRTVAGGKRYVIAGVGALHADANGLMVLEEEPGAAHVFEPVIEPVVTPVMAPVAPVVPPVPEPVVAPVALPVPEPVVAPVALPVPEPTLEPSWGSTIYKDTAPARQPELVWGAEPTTPRQPEPTFGFEPAPAPAPVAPAPAPAPRRDRADEQSKAFTLNDLYSDPEDENVPDLSQPQFGERNYTVPSLNERDYNAPSFNERDYNAPSFNERDYTAPSFNDAAFNGGTTLNDAVYGGAATLNDVYGAPEPPRQEHGRQEYFAPQPEYPAANHDYPAAKPERPADRFDGDSALRPPQLRRPSQIHSSHKRKPDFVVIIAIVAAVAAIGMIIYGLSNNDAVVRKPINAADTTAVQIDSAAMEMPLEE